MPFTLPQAGLPSGTAMIDKNAVAGHCLRLLSTRSLVTFLLSHLQVRKLLAKAIDLDLWALQTKQCPLP